MNRGIDDAISDVAYILDCLRALRDIYNKGNCNNCTNKECGYKPELGQMIRYNCPFYERK